MEPKIKLALGFCGLLAALQLAGCAKTAQDVTSSYISPMQYQNYSCQQLAEEAMRVSARVAELSGIQDKKASSDAVATGVAIVLFWPAAFLVGGNDQNTAELARLKGEFEAIQQTNVQRNCGLQLQQRTVPPKS